MARSRLAAESQLQHVVVVGDAVDLLEQLGVRLGMARVHLEQGDRVVVGVPEVLDVEGDAVEADLPDDPPGELCHALRHGGRERGGVLVAQEARAVRRR